MFNFQLLTRTILFLLVFVYFKPCKAQIINAYAEVTSVSGSNLTLGTVDESAHSFEDGDWIVIMQMQDDVIGDVTNSASFGDLGSINNTGIYEIRQVSSHTEIAGVPTAITLVNTPNYTYNTCANCKVQVVSFREFGAPDYTTTANMTAKPWDGTTGGVIAFHVAGTLTLGHNIDADLAGFRGAGPNAGGSAGCSGNSNFRVSPQADFADKGEGIYRSTNAAYDAGMAKILNAGGGGNSHNGGGGGGGNYTAGGNGGPGWPTCSPSAGGYGGISLQANSSVSRVFMGGGGGAGEGNNNLATDGGNGGGIVIIKANEIVTNFCAGISITANGESIAFAGNDGGGGGGAGGSIIFEVDSWNINGACPLTVSANGGDGGSVNSGAIHGGGGGGGQGVVYYSTTVPTTNVTTTTNNGDGGCNNDSSPCNSQAQGGSGNDGDGVQDLVSDPLPIELLYFNAQKMKSGVELYWVTASERENDYFNIERSVTGKDWVEIAYVDGAGNSNTELHYNKIDQNPHYGINYYRLKQTDFNGDYSYSGVVSVSIKNTATMVYPNPATNQINVVRKGSIKDIGVYNLLGEQLEVNYSIKQDGAIIDLSNLPKGSYILEVSSMVDQEFFRIVVKD